MVSRLTLPSYEVASLIRPGRLNCVERLQQALYLGPTYSTIAGRLGAVPLAEVGPSNRSRMSVIP